MAEFLKCPYDRVHRFPKSSMTTHLTKCRKNYVGEYVTCPFNCSHRVPKAELHFHLTHMCEDISYAERQLEHEIENPSEPGFIPADRVDSWTSTFDCEGQGEEWSTGKACEVKGVLGNLHNKPKASSANQSPVRPQHSGTSAVNTVGKSASMPSFKPAVARPVGRGMIVSAPGLAASPAPPPVIGRGLSRGRAAVGRGGGSLPGSAHQSTGSLKHFAVGRGVRMNPVEFNLDPKEEFE